MAGPGNTNRQDTMDMVAYYQKYHKNKMKGAGLNVADWGWLPIDEVIDFVLTLKHKYNCTGLRTYFGAHDKEVTPSENPYLGYNTAIFVGTQKVGGIHIDLDMLQLDGSGDFDLAIGKKTTDTQKPIALSGEDEDKQHLHPPDDDDNLNHASGDRILHPISNANAKDAHQIEGKQ